MVQLRLYLKELKDFLNTVTIKDEMLADSMLTTLVRDEWQEVVAANPQANPYYRALLGDYILFSHPAQLRQTIKDLYDGNKLFRTEHPELDAESAVKLVLDTLFPLTTTITFQDSVGSTYQREIPNSYLYRYSNEVPIISSYDESYKIPFAREFLYETKTGNELDLIIHSSTSVVYRIPNERYNTLVKRYPKAVAIIHSIVYPTPIDVADETAYSRAVLNKLRLDKILKADDISVLTYNDELLQEQERQSLVDCLTTTLDMVRRRYAIREFTYENLYAPAHYYMLWQILYLALFVQRIQNIHTGDAHLYHIWNYLKSNGFEDYRDILDLRQQKFIYKNLPYLLKHKGTEYIFEILDYVFFHTQNISLSGKNTIQSTSQGNITTAETTKRYPIVRNIEVGKSAFDTIHASTDSSTRFEEILYMLAKHAGQPVMNDREEYEHGSIEALNKTYQKERDAGLEYQEDSLFSRATEKQTKLLSYSPISHRNTKLLELRNNNTTDYELAMYAKFIGETILYRISKNNLEFIVEIQLPESTKKIELPVADWIGLIFYALDRASGCYTPTKSKCDEDKCYHDRPPSTVYVSWPYDIDMDEDYAIPETFKWYNFTCHTAFHLATLTSRFAFGGVYYDLADNRQDVQDTDRFWICLEPVDPTDTENPLLGTTLRYNYNKGRWNIVDTDENVIYHSSRVYTTSTDIESLSWSDTETKIEFKMVSVAKTYIADLHMPQYKNKIRSVEEFAEFIHKQGLGFIIMNREIRADESAINRAAYHMLLQHRCVGETIDGSTIKCIPLTLNLFEGKTYYEYLHQKSVMIDNLRLVLDRYDLYEDVSTIYSRMADAIIEAMLPKNDPYLPRSDKSMKYRYQKLVELFKNMTAYNLAYIDMQYTDIDSTKVSIDVSDYTNYTIKSNITDNFNRPGSDFDFKTTSVIKTMFKPTYPDQMSELTFKDTFSEDDATDTAIKQTILDNIDKIIEIYDTKRISKSKKHTRLVTLLGEDVTNAVENMSRETLDALQYSVHLISNDHVYPIVKPQFVFELDEHESDETYTDTIIKHKVNRETGYTTFHCEVCGSTATYTDDSIEYDPNI